MITIDEPKATAKALKLGAKSGTIVGNERFASHSPSEANKTEKVLSLLKQPKGATLDELVEATGWLPHTTRAALTGLKEKGHVVQRARLDGVSRYTLVQAVS